MRIRPFSVTLDVHPFVSEKANLLLFLLEFRPPPGPVCTLDVLFVPNQAQIWDDKRGDVRSLYDHFCHTKFSQRFAEKANLLLFLLAFRPPPDLLSLFLRSVRRPIFRGRRISRSSACRFFVVDGLTTSAGKVVRFSRFLGLAICPRFLCWETTMLCFCSLCVRPLPHNW